MVSLPETLLIHHNKFKEGVRFYSGKRRIAIADVDTIYGRQGDQSPADAIRQSVVAINPKDANRSEIIKKQLFLDALGVMLARNGHEIMPELLLNQQMARENPRISFAGTQNFILRIDFSSTLDKTGRGEYLKVAGNHALGKYQFVAGFLGDKPENHPLNKETEYTEPVFMVDNALLELMEKAKVPQEKIEEFFEGFMKIAELVEHDYVHCMMIPYFQNGLDFRLFAHHKKTGDARLTPLENHALALQSDIIRELFSQDPKRKDIVLRDAVKSLNIVTEIQEIMKESKSDEKDIREVGNYLSSIYMDRLLRAIEVNDKDLAKPIHQDQSVQDALEKIEVRLTRRTDLSSVSEIKPGDEENLTAIVMLDEAYNPAVSGAKALHHKEQNPLIAATASSLEAAKKQMLESEIPDNIEKENHLLGNVDAFAFITGHMAEKDDRHVKAGKLYHQMSEVLDNAIDKTAVRKQIKELRKSLRAISASREMGLN